MNAMQLVFRYEPILRPEFLLRDVTDAVTLKNCSHGVCVKESS